MKIGPLQVTFHRTVRVSESSPSNLPPSLGVIHTYKVSDYPNCPSHWEKNALFFPLHETEAMWISFGSGYNLVPCAVLLGAGGINALTGEKLGTKLVKDNYLVTPPQPWIDGWKGTDGNVYQFVSTTYKKGSGKTVAEQLIGSESKTGALGIAVYEAKDPTSISLKLPTGVGNTSGEYNSEFQYKSNLGLIKSSSHLSFDSCNVSETSCGETEKSYRGILYGTDRMRHTTPLAEMGVGKGGKIIQKIYPDPYGLDVWKNTPTEVTAIYLVNAEVFEQITGIKTNKPVDSSIYSGIWYGMNDKKESDVQGTDKFDSLKSTTEKNIGTASGAFLNEE